MSEALKKLIKEWDEECERFQRANKVFQASASNLSELNVKIYNLSKEECIHNSFNPKPQ